MLKIEGWKRVLIWAVVLGGLLLALPNGFYERVEASNDAEARIEAGFESRENLDAASAWPSFLPSGLVNLGLDLRGGAHLLAEVRLEEVYETRLEGFWPELRNALRPERETVGTIRLQESTGNDLRVRISQEEGMARAMEIARSLATPLQTLTGALQTDIDVSSDGDILIVRLSEAEQQATDERTMAQSLEIIRRRIDEAGTREPTIQRQG
ncbi:MAG: protein translocase subunit SecD, partial [Pseudomonadota bacterium]